jgi:acyl-CoA synthetase (AMP-forming)/AMP-acid ligase II
VMNGSTQIFGGPNPQPRDIIEIVHNERVTLVGAVPTVWIAIQAILEKEPQWDISSIRCIPIGGSAAPKSLIQLFDKKYGAYMLHAWGMTEMSPLGTVCNLLPKHQGRDLSHRLDLQAKQGRPLYGIEMKICDDEGRRLPHDGAAFGHLMVRGPWITSGYFKGDGGQILDADGFFDTGDVATIDPDGYMQVTDRSKDVIKSGGEWISSIELENAAMGHPAIAEAAVIGIAHAKWQERPVLIVVRKPAPDVTRDDVLKFLEGKVAKWWMPDDVVFVNELPHTATGKLLKTKLREMFKDYRLP